MYNNHFNSKKTSKLSCHHEEFNLLKNLINKDRIPKVLLLSGDKGIGKSTLINHLMHFYYDYKNYNTNDKEFNQNSNFHNQILNNIFPNIYYLNGNNLNNIKIENVRNLKRYLSTSTLNNFKRFIIFDDVEVLNNNSSNALLRIIEEPSDYNNYILINNKSNKLLETIKSRCIEIKIIINEISRTKILLDLIEYYNQTLIIDKDIIKASPGNILKFNYVLYKNEINLNESLLKNFKLILNFYKKDRDLIYKDLLLFIIDYYHEKNRSSNTNDYLQRIRKRSILFKNINDFFSYNLGQNTLLRSLESNYYNE